MNLHENILSEFAAFIEKSAAAMGMLSAQPTPPAVNTVTPQPAAQASGPGALGPNQLVSPSVSSQSTSRVGTTDSVNNTMSPGISNPSHGGAEGMPKATTKPGAPLKKIKF